MINSLLQLDFSPFLFPIQQPLLLPNLFKNPKERTSAVENLLNLGLVFGDCAGILLSNDS
jgi:hypothetical protein